MWCVSMSVGVCVFNTPAPLFLSFSLWKHTHTHTMKRFGKIKNADYCFGIPENDPDDPAGFPTTWRRLDFNVRIKAGKGPETLKAA